MKTKTDQSGYATKRKTKAHRASAETRELRHKTSKTLQAAASMPAGLYHTLPGEGFDIQKSEIVTWMIGNPIILQNMFDHLRMAEAIIFDPVTRTWAGRDSAAVAAGGPKISHAFTRVRENQP